MYTPPAQTRIIWVYFVLRQKFSYFEPLPLKTKGACYHSFTDSLSLKTIWAHQKISHSWFVSISPSLSTVLQIFPPIVSLNQNFLWVCCYLLNLLWIWMGLENEKKTRFETESVVLVKDLILFFLVL